MSRSPEPPTPKTSGETTGSTGERDAGERTNEIEGVLETGDVAV